MRDPERIDRILELVGRLWKRFPDQRFGQLVDNYIIPSGKPAFELGPLRYEEDDAVEERLKDTLSNLDRIPPYRLTKEEMDEALAGVAGSGASPQMKKRLEQILRDAFKEME